VQTTLERAFVSYDDIQSPWSFCVTALRHALHDGVRYSARRRGAWMAGLARHQEFEARDVADSVAIQLDVRRAISELPPRQSQAIELIELRDLDLAAAAARMDTNEATVKGLVQRARQNLRVTLSSALSVLVASAARLRRALTPVPVIATPIVTVAALYFAVVPIQPVPLPNVAAWDTEHSAPEPVARELHPVLAAASAGATKVSATVVFRGTPMTGPEPPGRRLPKPHSPVSACADKTRDPDCNKQIKGDEVCAPVKDYAHPCAKVEGHVVCDVVPNTRAWTCTRDPVKPI
jgi:RNA polymerase sigma factor (sigma-70 family)